VDDACLMSKCLLVALAAALAACASANDAVDDPDAIEVDGPEADAPEADAPDLDAPDLDAPPPIDAPVIDAPPIDAPAIDAPVIDAPPIDAPMPIDAPIDAMCNPTWNNLLVNGGFDNGVAPWTQTSTIIRDAGGMPFAPHNGMFAALFGASNNANDVLVQNIAVPAGATGLRVRAFTCFVTEDPIEDTDTFKITLETAGGAVLDTLLDITNSDTAPICFWQSATWTAATPHAGQSIVLRMRGTTNFVFLTRFAIDSMAMEWLGCP
jgi:hypothetical protein